MGLDEIARKPMDTDLRAIAAAFRNAGAAILMTDPCTLLAHS